MTELLPKDNLAKTKKEVKEADVPRWTLPVGLLLTVASPVAIVIVYYHVPLDRRRASDLVVVAALLGLYAVTFALLLRWIKRARYPRVRAVQSALLALSLFLVGFAYTYGSLSAQNPSTFNQPMGHTAALYFTVTVFATVGFGDITAVTDRTRVLVTVQMLLDVGFLAATIQIVAATSRAAVQRRQAQAESASAATSTPANDGANDKPAVTPEG